MLGIWSTAVVGGEGQDDGAEQHVGHGVREHDQLCVHLRKRSALQGEQSDRLVTLPLEWQLENLVVSWVRVLKWLPRPLISWLSRSPIRFKFDVRKLVHG